VHQGFLAGGKNTKEKYMEGGDYGEFSLLLLLEGGE
jgi:hypothetical protein